MVYSILSVVLKLHEIVLISKKAQPISLSDVRLFRPRNERKIYLVFPEIFSIFCVFFPSKPDFLSNNPRMIQITATVQETQEKINKATARISCVNMLIMGNKGNNGVLYGNASGPCRGRRMMAA